jgi:threonine aldolase
MSSPRIVEFRSDTFTLPTAEMRAVMASAPLGDDVFGEDPSINALQDFVADSFGMQAALFCPSGTMTNQIAINVHTRPGDEVICEAGSHVYFYEGGGIAKNSGAQVKLIHGNRGKLGASQLLDVVNPDDVHRPSTRLVSLENTTNRGGGACYSLSELDEIRAFCQQHGLGFHLDGARLMNAVVATGTVASDYGKRFDSISLCLSKGLGAPVGSVLMGSKEFIKEAKRVRKVLGGGMRQAGMLAAAGLYAYQNHVERLAEDHEHAKQLESVLLGLSDIDTVLPVETNIVIATLKPTSSAAQFTEKLKTLGIRISAISANQVRFVTHLNVSAEDMDYVINTLRSL